MTRALDESSENAQVAPLESGAVAQWSEQGTHIRLLARSHAIRSVGEA